MKKKVIRNHDVYQGERLTELPDLIVKWTNDAPVCSLTSPSIGKVKGTLKDPCSGTHRTITYFLGFGNRIRKSSGGEMSILDIAPTILSILESPVPESYAGKIRTDLFD